MKRIKKPVLDWDNTLRKGLGVAEVKRLASQWIEQEKDFLNLMHKAPGADTFFRMKAAWVISHGASFYPELCEKYSGNILDWLELETNSGALRELQRALLHSRVPEEEEGRYVDVNFKLLRNLSLDVAVRYNAMKILFKYCASFPELFPELEESLSLQREANTPTFWAMAKKERLLLERKWKNPGKKRNVRSI